MRRKTSGNTCARPISPTACSKTTPQSSTLASSHGVAFSTSSVASSPSPAVIGLLQVNHSEVWYYVIGSRVRVASAGNPANYMEGQCTAYSGTTLTVNVTRVGGTGTF